jgi:hypothetical protein
MIGNMGDVVSMVGTSKPPTLAGFAGVLPSSTVGHNFYGYGGYGRVDVPRTEFRIKEAWQRDPQGWITAYEAWLDVNPDAGYFERSTARGFFKKTWATIARLNIKDAKGDTERSRGQMVSAPASSMTITPVPTPIDPAVLAQLNAPLSDPSVSVGVAPEPDYTMVYLIAGLAAMGGLVWYAVK